MQRVSAAYNFSLMFLTKRVQRLTQACISEVVFEDALATLYGLKDLTSVVWHRSLQNRSGTMHACVQLLVQ